MTDVRVFSCHSSTANPDSAAPYEDELGVKYSYDTKVASHKQITEGHVLVIRDENHVLGFGQVERIDHQATVKDVRRCPYCGKTGFEARQTMLPLYHCRNGHDFDEPAVAVEPIIAKAAWYGSSWAPLAQPQGVSTLAPLYISRNRQSAIRELKAPETFEYLHRQSEFDLPDEPAPPPTAADPLGGQEPATVQRRIGQQLFRLELRRRFGDRCAITGPQPPAILDAAHLYSFADTLKHQLDGGLLLRTDIHRLFDSYKLTISPDTWTVEVDPAWLHIESLADLDGQPLRLAEHDRPHPQWLVAHREKAHEHWRQSAG